MQCCTDCGRSNRPGVHFCTHCGKPTAASGGSLGSPTGMVAVAVLAIGLLAFLTIRPVDGTQSPAGPFVSPPAAQHELVAGGEGLDRATAQVEAAAGDDESPDSRRAPDDAVHEKLGELAAPPFAVAGALDSAPQSLAGTSAWAGNAPGLDPWLSSIDGLETLSTGWTLSTPSPRGSPFTLRTAQALAGPAHPFPERAQASAAPAHASAAAAQAQDGADTQALDARPPPQAPAPASSSLAKRTAIDGGRARGDAAPARAKARRAWLSRLRAEIEACEGNLIVRTVCTESAKMRHCTTADAWGEVTECPAARLPDLATFD